MDNLRQTLNRIRTEIEPYFAPKASSEPSVPLNAPTFGADEVLEALESMLTTRVTMGEKVLLFEKRFAEYIGTRHAIMVNSGSSANLLIMAAMANPLRNGGPMLRPGDEVIVPAVTWSTTLWPVINMGCIPVLVDAELNTLNMSVEAARKAITPKTKAIFVAHILGNAADMDGLRALAKEKNLVLIEDSCESLGTRYKGQLTGRFSHATSYSFFFSHHITTIEGGMVVTDDDEFADLCRCLRAHGWTRHMRSKDKVEANFPEFDPRFLFVNIGYNLRPTEIQAAFGLHQLPKLASFNQRRIEIAMQLREQLAQFKDEFQMIEATEGVDHTWFGFPVILSAKNAGRRKEFVEHLERNGIETRPIIAGNLAVQPALKHFQHRIGGPLPSAQVIMERGVYWGSHPMMGDFEVDHIVKTISQFFRK